MSEAKKKCYVAIISDFDDTPTHHIRVINYDTHYDVEIYVYDLGSLYYGSFNSLHVIHTTGHDPINSIKDKKYNFKTLDEFCVFNIPELSMVLCLRCVEIPCEGNDFMADCMLMMKERLSENKDTILTDTFED